MYNVRVNVQEVHLTCLPVKDSCIDYDLATILVGAPLAGSTVLQFRLVSHSFHENDANPLRDSRYSGQIASLVFRVATCTAAFKP